MITFTETGVTHLFQVDYPTNRWVFNEITIPGLPHNQLQQIIKAMKPQDPLLTETTELQRKLSVALENSLVEEPEEKTGSEFTEASFLKTDPFTSTRKWYASGNLAPLYALGHLPINFDEQHVALSKNLEKKVHLDDTLTVDGLDTGEQQALISCLQAPLPSTVPPLNEERTLIDSGGSMADLSGYKDLSKAPVTFGDEEDLSVPILSAPERITESRQLNPISHQQHFVQQDTSSHDSDSEFSGNVKTLIRLVNELPEGVTKQTGAQIIRLTMEAMGISMEDVLSEAQSAQSEMLDAVRANIKKIEEYKTVIRKLETDIKFYQGKANELSEIIDLFILSNTSGNKNANQEE
jgi:hypothetical protein